MCNRLCGGLKPNRAMFFFILLWLGLIFIPFNSRSVLPSRGRRPWPEDACGCCCLVCVRSVGSFAVSEKCDRGQWIPDIVFQSWWVDIFSSSSRSRRRSTYLYQNMAMLFTSILFRSSIHTHHQVPPLRDLAQPDFASFIDVLRTAHGLRRPLSVDFVGMVYSELDPKGKGVVVFLLGGWHMFITLKCCEKPEVLVCCMFNHTCRFFGHD